MCIFGAHVYIRRANLAAWRPQPRTGHSVPADRLENTLSSLYLFAEGSSDVSERKKPRRGTKCPQGFLL